MKSIFEKSRKAIISVLACVALFMSGAAYAQGPVKGKVVEPDGTPVIGASVLVPGTTRGTITDVQGEFQINVAAGTALEVSCIGYATKTVTAADWMSVILEQDTTNLDEVVVVGYGVQKKVNLTGAVSSVRGEDLAFKNVMSTAQSLQGVAAGLTVTTATGEPDDATMRVRGIGTLNNNDPLILIDGVAGSMSGLDPNDIESVSVLKDAASAAIYGSRAANGVILITTKHGRSNDLKVTYKGTVSTSRAITLPQLVNAWEYLQMRNDANANDTRKADGTPGGHLWSDQEIQTWKTSTDRDAYPNSNIIEETFKPATETQHYLGIQTGTEKFSTNTSLNYTWRDGDVKNINFNRYGIRSNNKYFLSDWASISADISARRRHYDTPYGNGANLDQFFRQAPIYATKYSNGVWAGNYSGTPHVRHQIEDNYMPRQQEWSEMMGRFALTLTPVKGLSVDFSFAPKWNTHDAKNIVTYPTLYNYKTGEINWSPTNPNSISQTNEREKEFDHNILATYNVSLGKHDIAAMAGWQYLTYHYDYLYGYRDGNIFPQFKEINAFDVTNQKTSGTASEWALMSYFGRFNYAYATKYLFEANVRYDGSSRFAAGYRWGVFPSFSVGWRFSEESFMDWADSWLNNGKLRVSYGHLGNQQGVGAYATALNVNTTSYAVFGGEPTAAYSVSEYATQNLTWEKTTDFNVGIDLALFNKLNLSFDWYKKTTDGILMGKNIPYIMGYTNSPYQNVGVVENKGWDFTATWFDVKGDFSYRITANLADVHNKIIDMNGNRSIGTPTANLEGYPIGSLYGLEADGLFSSWAEAQAAPAQWGVLQGGDIRYKDLTGDGIVNDEDRTIIGNTIPRYTYSLDALFQWKGFDLDLFFQGVGKRDGYINGWYRYPFQNETTPFKEHLDYWQEGTNENPNAKLPRLSVNQQTNNQKVSTFWRRDASYLRLKNVQLGYRMPSKWFDKSNFISSCRLFVSGTNVFTIDHYGIKGMDPESNFSPENTYPINRQWTCGVEIRF